MLEISILIKIALILILLCLSAFFSSSETALFSLGSVKLFRLKESNHPKAQLIQDLLEKPRRLIISILVGNECINITASALAASLCISLFGGQGKWIAIAIMTPLILILGEVLPKTIAVSKSEHIAPLVARPIDIFARIISPLRWILKKLLDLLTALTSSPQAKEESIFLEEDIKELVEVGHQEGTLEKEEREMIHKILKLGDTPVASIMTPRDAIFSLPYDTDINQLVKEIKKYHFSRIPIYKKDRREFVGILNAKDLLVLRLQQGKTSSFHSLIRPPYFVPKDKRIRELLEEFQEKKLHLALVVNEYGSVIGLVTMEDILEELFGEIYDEFDHEMTEEQRS